MKEISGFLSAALAMLVLATLVLVLAPWWELSREQGVAPTLPAAERRGRQQYVALGCVYCHSQQPRPETVSRADAAWGWGTPGQPSTYAGQDPHLLGTMRTGPDLLRIGTRQPSRDWQLLHLYQPRLLVPESLMPAYPFLFEFSDNEVEGAVKLPEGGWIIPNPEAEDLLAYLLSLREEDSHE